MGVDDKQSGVVSQPYLVLTCENGTNGLIADEIQELVQIVQPFTVLPSIEVFAFDVGQPGNSAVVRVRHERVGDRSGGFGVDDRNLSVGQHNRPHGFSLLLILVELELAVVLFLIPHCSIQALCPYRTLVVLEELFDILQVAYFLPAPTFGVDKIDAVGLTAVNMAALIEQGQRVFRCQLFDSAVCIESEYAVGCSRQQSVSAFLQFPTGMRHLRNNYESMSLLAEEAVVGPRIDPSVEVFNSENGYCQSFMRSETCDGRWNLNDKDTLACSSPQMAVTVVDHIGNVIRAKSVCVGDGKERVVLVVGDDKSCILLHNSPQPVF